MNRRQVLAGSAAGLMLSQVPFTFAQAGRLKQSVARWCFADIPIEEFCAALQDMGITGMDLAGIENWDTCRRYGILPCMVAGAGNFTPPPEGSGRRYGPSVGWNRVENHAKMIKDLTSNVGYAAKAGLPNLIGLFGDRGGMSDEEGIENCVTGLKQVVNLLEDNNMTLGIELLNSKVDHPDYQGDNTPFGVEVCKRVGSERVKLVYDIYHMQIMEGNLIATIRDNIQWISHFHVAGVPGRHEIDATQEVNWKAVATAIADLDFEGYVAHEWTPTTDEPLGELRKAVQILSV